MKCSLYSRVSTRDKGQDVENRLVQLRKFAGRMGWDIVAESIGHETGKHSDRPQFQQMFADAGRRRFDVLLFWSLDRLSREGPLENLQHLNRLTSYGVQWRSLTEQYLDSIGIFREAVISILATVAKQERIRISEPVTAGLQRARAKAIKLGRPSGRGRYPPDPSTACFTRSWRAISKQLRIGVGTVHRIGANAA